MPCRFLLLKRTLGNQQVFNITMAVLVVFHSMEERSSDQKIDRIKDRESHLKAGYE